MNERNQDYFFDDEAARAKLEAVRWSNGVICPRCSEGSRIYHLGRIRRGLKKCGRCRKQFTIRTATVLESSHMPLHKWLQAVYLLSRSEKGDLVQKLGRALALDSATALAIADRLSEALRRARKRPPERRTQGRGWPKTNMAFENLGTSPGHATGKSKALFEKALVQIMSVWPPPMARTLKKRLRVVRSSK